MILFHIKDAIESPCPFTWLAVIAQYGAIESHVGPIFPLAQIAEAVFHHSLAQLKLH